MFTKAWKLMTPLLAKSNPSVYWDWSCESDGTRIMEVYTSDLTGHTSYILIRITRNSEEECDEEFEGQISDGYFEDYRGDIKGKEIKPDSIKFDPELIKKAFEKVSGLIAAMTSKSGDPDENDIDDKLMVIARNVKFGDAQETNSALDGFYAARDSFTAARGRYMWEKSEELYAGYRNAAKSYMGVLTSICDKIGEALC